MLLPNAKPDVDVGTSMMKKMFLDTRQDWIRRAEAAGWFVKVTGKNGDLRLRAWSPETLAAIAAAEAAEPKADVIPFARGA
jgi:hypothetical protein